MSIRRLWLVPATVVLAVLLGVGIAVSLATGAPTSTKASRQAPVQGACATALIVDWRDGRIDGVYPIACYRAAAKSLPADLLIYSSAYEDIAQALSQRIVQSAGKRPAGTGTRQPAG